MTATRKWTVGAALVSVLVLVAGWFLLISPKRAQVADLEAQTQTQLNENSQLQTELAVLTQQFKDLPKKQAELAAIQTKLPQSPDLPSYIRDLQTLATKSGVTLASMTPAAPVTIGAASAADAALTPETLAAINVDLVLDGQWDAIRNFVNDLETTTRYTLVSGLTIGAGEAETDDASALSATLNARIYLVPTAPQVTESIPGAEATPAPSTTP